jgi:predicted solute-binding protein
MKLGYIDYLNCYPFYHHLFENNHMQGVQVISGYPSALNKMLAEEALDLSPISAATYPDIRRSDFIASSILPEFRRICGVGNSCQPVSHRSAS